MFYAHFVLSKRGPLARIWLAAHWDKKLTKAHVFETNIDSSVEAILQPKVKMALRTSGHLLLGVVRIYSRKAKYLLADCNEAFVKIKMAFRPGIVDLPEDNREAAVNAITLPENFHDFDTTMADLNDIDVQAQFSVNQSRPEEITMREDLGNITLIGDDGFGDYGFDDTREILRDPAHNESLYKNPDASNLTLVEGDKSSGEKPMEVDEFAGGMKSDGFGDDGEGFMAMGGDSSDDDNEDNFGGDVDHELFGDGFNMDGGGLFEDAPMAEVSMVPEIQPSEAPEKEVEKERPAPVPQEEETQVETSAMRTGEQTTLMSNVEEAFALEPLDVTVAPGTERKAKRKRKLIVDEQKGIPSESMKLQLSDSSDIVTTLDLAPPTKKLMHWKETGGVEKLFALSGRKIPSKSLAKLFIRNLVTRSLEEWEEKDELQDSLQLDPPEVARDEEQHPYAGELVPPKEYSTIIEEPSNLADISTRSSRRGDKSLQEKSAEMPSFQAPAEFEPPQIEMPPEPEILPPAETSVQQPNIEENENEPLDTAQEEARVNKRTQQMLLTLTRVLQKQKNVGFKELTKGNSKKQAASKFYTFLVLQKQQAVSVSQSEPYADIMIKKGPKFETVY